MEAPLDGFRSLFLPRNLTAFFLLGSSNLFCLACSLSVVQLSLENYRDRIIQR